jgi:putative membrane protein
MLDIIVTLLVNALVVVIAAKAMSSIYVKSFGTALWLAIVIAIVGLLVYWILQVLSLGLFALLGISFIVRIIANAIVIEIFDKMSSSFDTKGFSPSLILAVLIAIAGAAVDYFLLS